MKNSSAAIQLVARLGLDIAADSDLTAGATDAWIPRSAWVADVTYCPDMLER